MFKPRGTISGSDLEFLFFLEEEFQDTEALLNGKQTEASFRVLATRARALLHTSESVLERAFAIFGMPVQIPLLAESWILYEQSENSPAVYRVEMMDKLDRHSLDAFEAKTIRTDVYTIATPVIGFRPLDPKHTYAPAMSLEDYCHASILAVDKTIIGRRQLVSYVANKRGLAHYSENREKVWQKRLDAYWNTKITSSDKSGEVRAVNELLLRIHVELLKANQLADIRRFVRGIRRVTSRIP